MDPKRIHSCDSCESSGSQSRSKWSHLYKLRTWNSILALMMERIKYLEILNKIKEQAPQACPGMLPADKTMANFIGHTVINLSDIELTPNKNQPYKKDSLSVQHQALPIRPWSGMTLKTFIKGFALNSTSTRTMGIWSPHNWGDRINRIYDLEPWGISQSL